VQRGAGVAPPYKEELRSLSAARRAPFCASSSKVIQGMILSFRSSTC
jgi:hypothetical protein